MPRTTLPAMLLAVAALSVPSVAPAQTWIHSWTLCTPSASFHSCHSVSIQTDAILDNTNTRTGTTISISMHNLQGQGYAADLTTSSGLWYVGFLGRVLPPGGTNYPSQIVPGAPSGGASGNPLWRLSSLRFFSGGSTWRLVEAYGNLNVLGGCGSNALSSPYVYGGHTCAPNSAFTFSFTLGSTIMDASEFSNVDIEVLGEGTRDEYCMSDASQGPYGPYPACDVQSESLTQVTPEPVTIALLGTGLFGIAGARLRRKKKDSSIDA